MLRHVVDLDLPNNMKLSLEGKRQSNTQSNILKFFVFLTSYHFRFLSSLRHPKYVVALSSGYHERPSSPGLTA